MSGEDARRAGPSRRHFLTSAVGAAAAGVAAIQGGGAARAAEPFHGPHQGGITTPQQRHSYFAAFDLTAARREDVAALLRAWTDAAARMARGEPAQPWDGGLRLAVPDRTASGDDGYAKPDAAAMAGDSGETAGLAPARLTVTFGFGAGLFEKDGMDRYGLAAQRPAALAELPRFVGDQLVPAQTGGDLSVQACADDPQVAFHAVRQLVRIADAAAQLRWVQSGFLADAGAAQTPRNLMGFKDGTNNPPTDDAATMAQFIWAGDEGPAWMRGGSYLVARRIRIAVEHWDRMRIAFQEQTFGRTKLSGAPLGGKSEFDAPDLDASDSDGNPVIAENAHIRLAAPTANDGARILRRSYSYNDGINLTAERWPPWRHELEYDAGLLFVCYQRDPRSGFSRIFERMAKFDMLNQFVTHVGGGLFACPGGAGEGEFIGQALFAAA